MEAICMFMLVIPFRSHKIIELWIILSQFFFIPTFHTYTRSRVSERAKKNHKMCHKFFMQHKVQMDAGNKAHLYCLSFPVDDGSERKKKFVNNKHMRNIFATPYPFPPSGSVLRLLSKLTRNFSIIVRLKAARYSSCSCRSGSILSPLLPSTLCEGLEERELNCHQERERDFETYSNVNWLSIGTFSLTKHFTRSTSADGCLPFHRRFTVRIRSVERSVKYK